MTLRDIDFPPEHEPLREDVADLGALVGEMLEEQGGADFFRRVEETRTAAIRRRQGEEGAAEALEERICGLAPAGARELIRAFSAYFRVVNLAEQVHRIRRRRDYLTREEGPQPGSFRWALERLRDGGATADEVASLLGRVGVEPVFTAHPTEATRPVLLGKEQRIARELIRRLEGCTPLEEEEAWRTIREEVTAAWQTEEHPGERPTVADEREHVLFYLTDVLWDLVPDLPEALARAADDVYGEGAVALPDEPPVRFASWVGGDMDGNPNVTADTVRETFGRHRDRALRLLARDLREVAPALSQSGDRVAVDEEVRDRSGRYAEAFPEALEEVPHRQRDMPYRVLLEMAAVRLDLARAGDEEGYASADDLADDLHLVTRSLRGHEGAHAGLRRVERILRRVRVFGFHLATLDGRQDALLHRRVVGLLLDDEGWMERPAEERAERLTDAIGSMDADGLPADAVPDDDEVRRTLEVFGAFAEARERHGTRAVGPFIISMTEGPDDVLTVLWLARAAGFTDAEGRVPLDVAPLLETVPDLEAAPEILQTLLRNPVYREHLEARGDRQMVMVGYSDSNKDGGVAASRWALHAAQTALVETLDGAGVELTVFHGRGGTVGRGGGKTHRAVMAAPRGSVAGRLRMTEQGEIIHQRYGIREIAVRELERMVSATALATAGPRDRQREAEDRGWHDAMETVARESRRTYRGLVYEDDDFVPYFRRATPIDVIERMPIGSRPASRRSGEGIEDLRAIPWVFSWMQSRHLLPGWYGLGSGLEAAVREHGRDTLETMVREWPFLRTVLEDVEMVLAKADLDIARRYAALAGDAGPRIFAVVREEFERTVEQVTSLRGTGGILEDDPTLARSIQLRNPYVDPMSLLQVDLLQRWRDGGREDDELFQALVESVIGIAQGMRNTG